MGRAIRRVPPDWEHPKYHHDWKGRTGYIPLFDQDYPSVCEDWLQRVLRWERGEDEDRASLEADLGRRAYYWEWDDGSPAAESYRARSWTPEEATHYQVYETVSEGTPITPVFASLRELVEHLVAHGTDWDQRRGEGGWDRAAAEAFARSGQAFSGKVGPEGVTTPRDAGFWQR